MIPRIRKGLESKHASAGNDVHGLRTQPRAADAPMKTARSSQQGWRPCVPARVGLHTDAERAPMSNMGRKTFSTGVGIRFESLAYFRCLLTSLVISNMLTVALPPNTGASAASALMTRLFFASCSLFFLM
jgi:hypothetical protein